jgi:ubiquitin carboxyl-terminal hydrolase 14
MSIHDAARAHRLTVAAKELFRELSTAKQPVTPFRFLSTLRELYPQFGQTGQGGVPMQQDAEECYTQLMYALKEALKANGGDPLTDLMGVKLTTTLKCVESDESFEEKQVSELWEGSSAPSTAFILRPCQSWTCPI